MSLPTMGESVRQDCPCCGLPTTVRLREVTESPACPACKEHGGNPATRDRAHRELWSAAAREIDKRHKERQQALGTQIHHLEDESERLRGYIVDQYKADISEDLRDQLESDVVAEAERSRQAAFSREAEVMNMLLLDIEPRHRGKRGPDSECSCGVLARDCPEWKILEPFRVQLKVWEGNQLKRMSEGKPHGLSRRHPKVAKREHEFKGLDDALAQPFSE